MEPTSRALTPRIAAGLRVKVAVPPSGLDGAASAQRAVGTGEPKTSRAASKCARGRAVRRRARMRAVSAGVDGGAFVPGLYVGWLNRGLTGIIGTNIADA